MERRPRDPRVVVLPRLRLRIPRQPGPAHGDQGRLLWRQDLRERGCPRGRSLLPPPRDERGDDGHPGRASQAHPEAWRLHRHPGIPGRPRAEPDSPRSAVALPGRGPPPWRLPARHGPVPTAAAVARGCEAAGAGTGPDVGREPGVRASHEDPLRLPRLRPAVHGGHLQEDAAEVVHGGTAALPERGAEQQHVRHVPRHCAHDHRGPSDPPVPRRPGLQHPGVVQRIFRAELHSGIPGRLRGLGAVARGSQRSA